MKNKELVYSLFITLLLINIGCEKNELENVDLVENNYEEYKDVPCVTIVEETIEYGNDGKCNLILEFTINPELNIHPGNVGTFDVQADDKFYDNVQNPVSLGDVCTEYVNCTVQLYDKEGLKAGTPLAFIHNPIP